MIMHVVIDHEGYADVISSNPCNGSNPMEVPDDMDLSALSCYKDVDGQLTLDEAKLAAHRDAQEKAERRAQRTLQAKEHLFRKQAQADAQQATEKDDVIALTPLLSEWTPKKYAINDIVQYGDAPYRCVQAHDASGNPGWNPVDAASLWGKYHATSAEYALPWTQPTGAHDAYQKGEYMVYTDKFVYRCKANNTVHTPAALPGAWERV